LYGKIGMNQLVGAPAGFALEFSYELGEWDFGGDINTVDVENLSFLFSSEIKF